MKIKSFKLSALLLLSVGSFSSFAQRDCNLFPYADGVVYDNNGHDLAGFAKKNKKDVAATAEKIHEFSGGAWGYVQTANARVPTVQTLPGKEKKVILNYSQYIDATVALFNTADGMKGTWWARECNSPEGAMYYKKADDHGNLDIPNVRFGEMSREMEIKKFTIVEMNDTMYNQRDYDKLLKNDLLVESGVVKNVNDYREIIAFYNAFLSKFTYVDDPLLEHKSFITFLKVNNTRYVGYFNIVNGKLSGHLETVDFQFEADKDPFIERIVNKLKGKSVFVYGDDIFGLEKTLLKYKHNHRDMTFVRRKTSAAENFNQSAAK